MADIKIVDKLKFDNNTYVIKDSNAARTSHLHEIDQINNLQDELDDKVNKVEGKQLSSNDFTDEDKNKLNIINLFFEEITE